MSRFETVDEPELPKDTFVMTYFAYLALFVGLPILLLALLIRRDRRSGRTLPAALTGFSPGVVVLAHVIVAVLYTTPWDNYLVATRVWWYDEKLVTGLIIGWVPIEEYTFFVLQTIMTSMMLLAAAVRPRFQPAGRLDENGGRPFRWHWPVFAGVFLLWVGSTILLFSGWKPGTYLALELSWALVPILVQLAFGADIIWRQRRTVIPILVISTLYLSATDAVAISSGTWTIDPEQSVGFLLGGLLPVEEFLFFFLTNTLVVFGVTLVLSTASRERLSMLLARIRRGPYRKQTVN